MAAGRATAVRRVHIAPRTAVALVGLVIAAIVVREMFVAAHRVIGWGVASVAVAVFVDPIIDRAARYVPRVAAVLGVFVAIGAIALAIVAGLFADLDTEIRDIRREAPAAAERLAERDDEIGRLAEDLRLVERAEEFGEAIDERFGGGASNLASSVGSLPTYGVGAILTIFLLIYGPGIAEGAVRRVPVERRSEVRTVVSVAVSRARRTIGALLLQGGVVGTLAGAVAWALDLPAPVGLGLLAGVASMVPDVGIILGGIPLVAFAAGLESVTVAAGVLAGLTLLQVVEAAVVRPWVDRRGVRIGASVIWIVALVGFTIYGLGMAFYGVVYAAFVLGVVDELGHSGAGARAPAPAP